jgi:hypothetical protein
LLLIIQEPYKEDALYYKIQLKISTGIPEMEERLNVAKQLK